MTMRLTFALNAHGPTFERYALLCTASIRHWCGDQVDIQIHEPTNLPPCSPEARAFFLRHGAEIRSFHNPFLPDHLSNLADVPARLLTYNKLFTLLDVQPGELRVFLDADQMFLADPAGALMHLRSPAGLVAADTPESFLGDWDSLYRDFHLPPPDRRIQMWSTYAYGQAPEPGTIHTHPYFCSGLVAVTAESELPHWWIHFTGELERRIEQLSLSYFVDQVALPLAAQATGQQWELFSTALSATPHVFRFIGQPVCFHYWGLDALAAQAARTPALHQQLRLLCRQLLEETGLDLRFQLLTQYPRWYRRAKGILRSSLHQFGVRSAEPMRH